MKRRDLIVIRAFVAILVCMALTIGCQDSIHADKTKKITQSIGKGDDPTRILGKPYAMRHVGIPAQVDNRLREVLARVHTNPGDIPRLKIATNGKQLDLPLDHTHVKASLVGYVAEVEVTQTYQNPFEYPIEAIYVFPLPENSAVTDMKMVIGKRVIEAEIKKRDEARKTYNDAKRKGHTTALLEQERPNIFTQSVANIEPRENIDVKISYVQNLTYDAGEYEFVFPMVVGPRFIPGNSSGTMSGTGWVRDTGEVPDASRITPLLVGGGVRTGHDISLELTAEAGFAIGSYSVPTHEVVHTPSTDGSLHLRLAKRDSLPNRDFVLKYGVSGTQLQASMLTYKKGRNGYFSLIIQPPELDIDEMVGRREIIFVVDVSGSMSGVPLALCKDAMEEAISALRPVDTFNVITFESRTGKLFEHPRPANDTNIRSAFEFVSGMRAGGGTMMGLGVEAALSSKVAKDRRRYVFFMTDGYIGNEDTIMSMTRRFVQDLEARGQGAKVFSFGTGSSVNRHLLDGIAKAGKGLAVYASNREDPSGAVNQFFGYIDHPVLEDVKVDWGDARVTDVFPADPGDLFASRPLILHGKFKHGGLADITIHGKMAERLVEVPLDVKVAKGDGNPLLASLWARAKVDWHEKSLIYNGHDQGTIDTITKLGLEHRLVTRFTSFVAVDRSRVVDGKLRTIAQPVETPEGVDPYKAGAKVIGMDLDDPLGALMGSQVGESFGYGGLTIVGTGRGGGSGSGYGRGAGSLGGRRASSPRIRSGATIVKGSLSGEVIRRIVRRHINEVKFCYERELSKHPELTGRVVVKFVISETGAVQAAAVLKTTINNPAVENCIIQAIKRWAFPTPAGGVVVVTMPFSLVPPNN
ncbi:MAG: TonB family protein [Deltaproteobacteria bacterium]|nr:TonB family protein [Deltaproteobacteria bacterium]